MVIDHFTKCTNTEPLCCIAELNTMLYTNYILKKNKKRVYVRHWVKKD